MVRDSPLKLRGVEIESVLAEQQRKFQMEIADLKLHFINGQEMLAARLLNAQHAPVTQREKWDTPMLAWDEPTRDSVSKKVEAARDEAARVKKAIGFVKEQKIRLESRMEEPRRSRDEQKAVTSTLIPILSYILIGGA